MAEHGCARLELKTIDFEAFDLVREKLVNGGVASASSFDWNLAGGDE